jgi:XTP/dITP diphosphohydrolase
VRVFPFRLALATTNRGKLAEIATLLATHDVEVVAADQLIPGWSVVEDGATFEENARIKANDLARRADLPALGDDSGLEVAALGGRPGVHSARYAGPGASDADRIAKLLNELRQVADGERAATFRCGLALAWPNGRLLEVEGHCEGTIARAPRGNGGFGYDPVFVDPATGLTFAELPADVKNERSHRRRALDALCVAVAERGAVETW